MIDLGCSSDLQPGFRPCRMDFGQQGRILIHLGVFRICGTTDWVRGAELFCRFLLQAKSRWHRKI
jgi:hypothetical protein